MKVFLKIVILNKTNNDCIFCKNMIHYMYINNQKGENIWICIRDISRGHDILIKTIRRTAMVLITAVSASVTNCCIRRREKKESRNFSKTLTGKGLMKIIRGLAQAFGKIPPIITVSADQI